MQDLALKADLVARTSRLSRRLRRDERGMATAEYAIGTVAVLGLGGVILKIISDPAFQEIIWKFIVLIFNVIMKSLQ